jgi:hypothetical protein
MRNLSAVSALLVGFLGAAGAIAVVACGTTPNGIVPDSGGSDASPDRIVPQPDGGKDVSRPDVTVIDTGTDTGIDSGVDSGHDTGMDAGMDVGIDAPRDSGKDVVLIPDVGPDAPPPALTFPALVTKAYCERASLCCVGDASASFNAAKCESDALEDEYVPLTNLGFILNSLTSTKHTFNQANADACITALNALSCASNSAADLATVVSLCSSAYVPELASGAAGCESSFDCKPGTYCAPIVPDPKFVPGPPDGGGTCLPLIAPNSTCADLDLSSDCTYAPGSVPTAFCADGDAGTPICQPAQANSTDCTETYEYQECTSGQCQPSGTSGDYTCQGTAIFTVLYGNNVCALYAQ